jgi:hypothetical protein
MKLYDVIRREQKLEEEKVETSTENFVFTESPKKKRKRIFFIAIILGFICILYISSIYLVRAKVYIEERSIPFSLDKTVIELSHETKSDAERLSFQTMSVTTEISREIFGSESKEVSGKARGSIVFFNEYSKNSITIKSSAKVIAQNGKSYLTQKSVVIPGYKLVSGKKVAGTSPSVTVVATEVGKASNSEGTSLTISGYSGTKKAQIYARSVGSFTGGEAGMKHSISEADKPQILDTLKTQLTERLRRETRAQIPEQLITYPDLQFISIDTESLRLEGDGIKFPAYIKGTMVSYLIPRDLFESAIAKEALSDHSYNSVSIPNLADLSVVAKSGVPADPEEVPDTISIEITGQGSIITQVSDSKIQEILLGVKRGSFNSIISNISEISSAKYKLFPFWAPFFPKQERFIKVDYK